MTRAIIIPFHAYTPFGTEFYQPLLDFQLKQLEKYNDEWDHLYLIEDDNWTLAVPDNPKITVCHVNASLRYYDAYKEVLPQVKEDLVLFMDDDMVVSQPDVIARAFRLLKDLVCVHGIGDSICKDCWDDLGVRINKYDVVSITDTIGTMKVDLKTGNKLCPYFFATRQDLLMKYLDIDWSPDAMPYTETFGLLTEAMLKDGCKVYEMEDDKTEVKSWDSIETDKTFGYYHIRAGSAAAYLLATKKEGNLDTYWDYLKNQPRSEITRHCSWYHYLGGDPSEIIEDLKIYWDQKLPE